MLEDMTHVEWSDWLHAFNSNPWDQQRLDERNAVACLWAIAPYMPSDDGFVPPGFMGPEYKSETEENTSESWERLQALKKRILDGKLNSKTSDPADH